MPQQLGFGPGGVGGGTQADFDSLIELVTTTIAPDTWDEVGGPGSVSGFEGNLSLVISQTQEVHEQIADLLEQLRRLQDLQVTIEVRFITLNDDFFERIGVDFDFDIDDGVGPRSATDSVALLILPVLRPDDSSASTRVIGLESDASDPTGDLDLELYARQLRFGFTPVRRLRCHDGGPTSALPSSATSKSSSCCKPPKATSGRTSCRPPR